jgi:hypothetical protein
MVITSIISIIISTTVTLILIDVLIVTAHSRPTAYITPCARAPILVVPVADVVVRVAAARVRRGSVVVVVGGSGVVVLLVAEGLRLLGLAGVVGGGGVGGRGGGLGVLLLLELVGGARELLHQVHEVVAARLQDGGGHLLGRALALLLLARALGGLDVAEHVHVVAASHPRSAVASMISQLVIDCSRLEFEPRVVVQSTRQLHGIQSPKVGSTRTVR